MWKIVAGLLVLAFLLSAAWMFHGGATGIGVPYQDPTPEEADYVRYHWSISKQICLASAAAWLAAGIAAWVYVVRRLLRNRCCIPGVAEGEN